MICQNCGSQIADNSTFCNYCGASVEIRYQQPEAQATVMQEPVAQPQYQQPPVNNDYAAGFYSVVKQYIETAGSVLVPSIVGLALSWAIPLIGQIVGLIMAGNVNGKLRGLPFIDETMIDSSVLEEYNSARRKIKTAGILTKINKIYSIVMLIFWIGYSIFWILYFMFFIGLGVIANM